MRAIMQVDIFCT